MLLHGKQCVPHNHVNYMCVTQYCYIKLTIHDLYMQCCITYAVFYYFVVYSLDLLSPKWWILITFLFLNALLYVILSYIVITSLDERFPL